MFEHSRLDCRQRATEFLVRSASFCNTRNAFRWYSLVLPFVFANLYVSMKIACAVASHFLGTRSSTRCVKASHSHAYMRPSPKQRLRLHVPHGYLAHHYYQNRLLPEDTLYLHGHAL